MKRVLIIFCLFSTVQLYSEISPLPPTINYLSVDSVSSQVEIYWTNHSLDVVGYIIYYYDLNNIWVPLDTVNGINNTYYKTTQSNAIYSSQKYSIVAFDSNQNNSSRSEPHSTIYSEVNYNLCAKYCDISWNKYSMDNMLGYKLFIQGFRTENQQLFFDTIINLTFDHLDTSFNSYYLYYTYNIDYNSNYTFTIAAYDQNDSLSRSNNFFIQTTNIEIPEFLYIRSINNLDSVKIKYHINNFVDIDEIEVYKRVENGDFYKHITIAFDSLDLSITDYNVLDNTYYYYLSPVDKCGNSYILPSHSFLSDTSVANTLNLNYQDNLYFTWNNYEGFFDGVDRYNIFTNINNVYNDILNIDNNYFPFELQDYGRSCFYLYAIEDFNNAHGFQDTSFSNKVCLQQPPLVFFPNTFSPNSDNKNELFGPSIEGAGDISYYCFNILDKWGNIIFNSIDKNISWNGLIKGGHAPIGVYFYDLVFNFPENNIYNTSGSIYLIR